MTFNIKKLIKNIIIGTIVTISGGVFLYYLLPKDKVNKISIGDNQIVDNSQHNVNINYPHSGKNIDSSNNKNIIDQTKEAEIITTHRNEPNIKTKTIYNSEFNSYEKISFKKVMTDLYKELIEVYPPVIENVNVEDEIDVDYEYKHYKIYISDFEMENGNVSKFNKLLKSKLNDDLFNAIKYKNNYTINTIMDNSVHFTLKSKIIIETKDNLRVSFQLITDNKIIVSLTYDYITESK